VTRSSRDAIKTNSNTTEVNLARRPTGYIPTPANANFVLGSDAVRGQLEVLYPAIIRGRKPIGRNAMKTGETWNTDGILRCQTFSNIVHIIGNSLESSDNAYNSTAPPN